jgi:hypothetical protein
MTVKGHGVGGGKSAAAMREEQNTAIDNMPMITRCALCDWLYEGTALEGRELAKGHRRVHHPDIKVTRRRRQSLQRWTNKQEEFRSEGLANAAKVAASLARFEDTHPPQEAT